MFSAKTLREQFVLRKPDADEKVLGKLLNEMQLLGGRL